MREAARRSAKEEGRAKGDVPSKRWTMGKIQGVYRKGKKRRVVKEPRVAVPRVGVEKGRESREVV